MEDGGAPRLLCRSPGRSFHAWHRRGGHWSSATLIPAARPSGDRRRGLPRAPSRLRPTALAMRPALRRDCLVAAPTTAASHIAGDPRRRPAQSTGDVPERSASCQLQPDLLTLVHAEPDARLRRWDSAAAGTIHVIALRRPHEDDRRDHWPSAQHRRWSAVDNRGVGYWSRLKQHRAGPGGPMPEYEAAGSEPSRPGPPHMIRDRPGLKPRQ